MLYIQYTHPFCLHRRIEKEHTELVELQVRIQRGGQGVQTPPGKSQVKWVTIGNKQLDPPPPWKKLDPPPPLEHVGPPLEP